MTNPQYFTEVQPDSDNFEVKVVFSGNSVLTIRYLPPAIEFSNSATAILARSRAFGTGAIELLDSVSQ
jgi:hypothetical protein